jgi:DNA-binding winged helix-turn-helix (wHTH) protein
MPEESKNVRYEFGSFRLDPARRLLANQDGDCIGIPPRAFDLLLYFVEHPGTSIDKAILMKAVWPQAIVEDNNLSQQVSTLRRTLGEGSDGQATSSRFRGVATALLLKCGSRTPPNRTAMQVRRDANGNSWIGGCPAPR